VWETKELNERCRGNLPAVAVVDWEEADWEEEVMRWAEEEGWAEADWEEEVTGLAEQEGCAAAGTGEVAVIEMAAAAAAEDAGLEVVWCTVGLTGWTPRGA
jgi:alkylation response protein AidB-like acyl-CoA dehydrogenase